MRNDLRERYLEWLEPQTGAGQHSRSYKDLVRTLFDKEFTVWLVPNDDNRIADGLDLRNEFCNENGLEKEDLGPCSFLEVLVALSRRLAFAAGGPAPGWAWQLICNLELHKFADPIRRRKEIAVDEILNNVIWRNYARDGMGGFFPLIDSEVDQSAIEIWYQMAAYVEEIHSEY